MTSPNDPTRPPREPFLVDPLDVPAFVVRALLASEHEAILEPYAEADARATHAAFEQIEPPELNLPEGFLRAPLNRAERRHLAAVERQEARADERAERKLEELRAAKEQEGAELDALLAEHGIVEDD